jgi:hypothetical protein
MLEKLGQIAEQSAVSASRRQFLGQLGKGALTVAAAVGGLLAFPCAAEAGAKQTVGCCLSSRNRGERGRCRVPGPGCTLVYSCYRLTGSRSPVCVWNCSGSTVYTGCVR